ncbi:MAG TPA: DUF4846 domain-containing protein, partial [Flavipsychrobacter sp.]|nr:DUF4846 domain-containing protein [Flavipsychrobacter sp.]
PPPGYRRRALPDGSFGKYLRSLPLKPHGSPVLYYNGDEKPNNNIYSAVVAMDIGKYDLQQCADAVMRLRAEYLYNSKQADKIHFNFTSGFQADYSKWAAGNRITVNGNHVSWQGGRMADHSYASFRKYLEMVFSYAGTLSLSSELQRANYRDLQIGDVFIQGGSPGHAVIVVDVAENSKLGKLYLLAQSYMPAQETQILNNPMNRNINPWYELDETQTTISTPQWDFTSSNVKRFPSE